MNIKRFSKLKVITAKKTFCSLCKAELPFVVRNRGREVNLLLLGEIQEDSLVLEHLKSSFESIQLFVIDLSKGEVSVGSGRDCEVRIKDLSVSKKHCVFAQDKGKFTFRDASSRFGSFVKLNSKLELANQTSLTLHSGKAIFQIDSGTRVCCNFTYWSVSLPNLAKQNNKKAVFDLDSFSLVVVH